MLTLTEKFLWRIRGVLYASPQSERLEGPIVVAGLYRAASGIGQAVRGLADALEAEGRNITRVDLSDIFDQAELPNDTRLERSLPARGGTLIIQANAPETDRALLALRCFRPQRWRLIGCWVWETPCAPECWRAPSRRFSEIWAPSHFAVDAIQKVSATPVKLADLRVAPPPSVRANRSRFGLEAKDFVILTMADARSSLHRKNPLGAIEAFRRGLPDAPHARLVVKLRNVDANSRVELFQRSAGDPRIVFLDEDLDEAERWALIDSCDVYLSLHRAEGFGMPIAEAMALGKPVVATGWSGNMDFMTPENAFPVPFRMTSIVDPAGRYAPDGEWAEPDIESAAATLSRISSEAALRRRIGDAASASMRRYLTPAFPALGAD